MQGSGLEIMKALYSIAKQDLELKPTISKEHWKFKFPHFDAVETFEDGSSEEEEGKNPEETKKEQVQAVNEEPSYTVQVELHEL